MPDQPSQNASSELVQHVRSVHFSLLLACFIALFAVLVGTSNKASLADDQLEHMLAVRDQWGLWPIRFAAEQLSWLKQNYAFWSEALLNVPTLIYVPREALINMDLHPARKLVVSIQPATLYVYVPMRDINNDRREIVLARWQESRFEVIGPERPETIYDIQMLWDGAAYPRFYIADKMDSNVMLFRGNSFVDEPLWTSEAPDTTHQSASVELRVNSYNTCFEASVKHAESVAKDRIPWTDPRFPAPVICGTLKDDSSLKAALIVHSTQLPIHKSLQDWLIEYFRIDAPSGSFQEAFPELQEITQKYRSLSLNDVKAIIEGELDRSGERVEFLGLRLPESAVANWGLPVIFTIQLYLLIHLRSLVRHISKGSFAFDMAWIALYPDALAMAVSYVSICIFPIGTALFIASRRFSYLVLLWGPMILFAAVASWLSLSTLRSRDGADGALLTSLFRWVKAIFEKSAANVMSLAQKRKPKE